MSSRTRSKKSLVLGLWSKVQSPKSAVSPPKSAVFIPHSAFRIPHSQAFTLIELLVAMGILMILVLMLANLFQASTRAWDTGMLQAEVGLQARAAVALIHRDLGQAVANSNYTFTANGSSLSFFTFDNASTGTPQQVTYSGGLTRNGVPLLENATFSVDTSYGGLTGATNLPDWVEIGLELSSDREFSGVRVFAQGRQYDPASRDWVDTR